MEGREYRVSGLEKTLGTDALKVALRLRAGERFHLDQVDLCRDAERRRFIERAAEETGLTNDLLKRDVGASVARRRAGASGTGEASGERRGGRHAVAGGTRSGAEMVARAEPHRAFARGVPPGRHHRRGKQHARCVSGGRVPQAGKAAGHHHPERQRRRQNHAHGRGAVVLPGGGARQILRHDGPIALLPGRDEPQTQNPRRGRGSRSGARQLRA